MSRPTLFLFSAIAIAVFAVPHDILNKTPTRVGANSDEIIDLPGLLTQPNFRQFAGYLDLPSSQKHLFYWLVEAENDPENAPVVLWTNGGPGCSGFIGFLSELGPFRPMQNLSLAMNPHAWVSV
jgi:cathepsin A (carboxypeptidase C)